MCQRPGPLHDGPAAPRAVPPLSWRRFPVAASAPQGAWNPPRGAGGTARLRRGYHGAGSGVGLGGPVPRRAGRASAWGRAAPCPIPHPQSRIPYPASPQGPRAPFPLRGCRRWGGGGGAQGLGGPPARAASGGAPGPLPGPTGGASPAVPGGHRERGERPSRRPGNHGAEGDSRRPAQRRGVWGGGKWGVAGEAAPLRRASGARSL